MKKCHKHKKSKLIRIPMEYFRINFGFFDESEIVDKAIQTIKGFIAKYKEMGKTNPTSVIGNKICHLQKIFDVILKFNSITHL